MKKVIKITMLTFFRTNKKIVVNKISPIQNKIFIQQASLFLLKSQQWMLPSDLFPDIP